MLYTFTGAPDGVFPSDLVLDATGNVFGTTTAGGAGTCASGPGCGTVFKLNTRTGRETILYRFAGGTDGAFPIAVIRDMTGNLYGTTGTGGNPMCTDTYYPGCGTVFELDTAGQEIVLHRFSKTDGARPSVGLLRNAAGIIYGVTTYGGSSSCNYGCGTVFEIKP